MSTNGGTARQANAPSARADGAVTGRALVTGEAGWQALAKGRVVAPQTRHAAGGRVERWLALFSAAVVVTG